MQYARAILVEEGFDAKSWDILERVPLIKMRLKGRVQGLLARREELDNQEVTLDYVTSSVYPQRLPVEKIAPKLREIIVPDKEEKEESGATEECHRLRKKGVPAKIRIKLMQEPTADDSDEDESGDIIDPSQEVQEDEVRADVPYLLEIDGEVTD